MNSSRREAPMPDALTGTDITTFAPPKPADSFVALFELIDLVEALGARRTPREHTTGSDFRIWNLNPHQSRVSRTST